MKKNYYEMLGITKDATKEDVINAFNEIARKYYPNGFATEDATELAEYEELHHAKEVLKNRETREEYDKTLSVNSVKNLKVNPNAKKILSKGNVAFASLVVAAAFFGSLLGNSIDNWSNNKDTKNVDSSISTANESDASEPAETIEEQKLLTAENFEEKVQEILADNQSKGLNIDPTFIRSALFITNIDYLDQEDIKKLYGNIDLNMIEEIQNMYNYTSAVGTHNNNVVLDQEEGQYIALSALAYDEQDRTILYELDQEFVDLVNDLRNQNMTDEQFQASFKYITEFYTGKSPLVTDGVEYDNYSLTSGAGLLSEQYWPMFSVNYANSEFVTNENMVDIRTLSEGTEEQPAVINGSKYLGAIINHEALACLQEEPTSEKTM